jgi:hypothetical protein
VTQTQAHRAQIRLLHSSQKSRQLGPNTTVKVLQPRASIAMNGDAQGLGDGSGQLGVRDDQLLLERGFGLFALLGGFAGG